MSRAEVINVEYAQGDMPETFVYKNGSEDSFIRILFRCFLIKTEDRNILVDAGCETMPGWKMYDFIGPIRALKKINLSPDDITDVIITHAHGDHIECVNYFKNSNIYIQRDEYENGKDYFTDNMSVILFDDEYKLCDAVRVVKIASHSAGSCVVEVVSGDDKYVISGDEFYIWETINELKERMKNKDFIPANECERKRAEFIRHYSDWKIVLSHSD